jgi:hypothetical protein
VFFQGEKNDKKQNQTKRKKFEKLRNETKQNKTKRNEIKIRGFKNNGNRGLRTLEHWSDDIYYLFVFSSADNDDDEGEALEIVISSILLMVMHRAILW